MRDVDQWSGLCPTLPDRQRRALLPRRERLLHRPLASQSRPGHLPPLASHQLLHFSLRVFLSDSAIIS